MSARAYSLLTSRFAPAGQVGTAVTDSTPMPVSAGGFTAVPAASKTRPANATAYSVGQVVSESTSAGTAWTFSDCARSNGGTGTVLGVTITDSSKQSTLPQFTLWLFTAALNASMNDAGAFAPTAADLANLACAPINLSNFVSANANGVLTATELNRPFKCAGGSTGLYGVLVAANAYTPVSGEIFTITLQIGQD